jgi:beta-glucosidase
MSTCDRTGRYIDELISQRNVAVLSVLYPGQEAGDGIMSLLFGDVSPAGKLPYTWYKKGFEASRPSINDNDLRSGQGVTYRYYKGIPLLPFGFGLSYTTFVYKWATLPPASVTTSAAAGEGLTIAVHVHNVGTRQGDAVVFAFVATNLPGCPSKSLGAFDRVSLDSDEAHAMLLTISAREIACADETGALLLRAADLIVTVGDTDHAVMATVVLTGPTVVLDP